MSHFSTPYQNHRCRNPEGLPARPQVTVKREADVRATDSVSRADLVAVLEGEYDLGWSRNSDGSFDLIADLWGVAKSITRPIKLYQPKVCR